MITEQNQPAIYPVKIIKSNSELYTSDIESIELDTFCKIERVQNPKSVNKYHITYFREVYTCGCCGNEECYKYRCEKCGATFVDGKWRKICSSCCKEADELFDLFVPHNCKKCSDKLHNEARKNNDYCLICRELRMDCCC